ncbi:non-ribosomal peptide synthetase/type I polyketide synthase [Ruegeria sp. HKCCC1038]|uniref:non-ribosomal peptide synthetase/type I polyketide synthase n=1 Tax=Ruegeria sp. HKCCC1038 TaxID=2682982 RepID=UPI0014889152|nr:non-ribosomal peptide synthetase/type I polyketide synthase [Ruegeria sp. HKCCC1038]
MNRQIFPEVAESQPLSGTVEDLPVSGHSDVVQRFRQIANELSKRTAVRFGDEAMDYATLDRRSDALALWLIDQGVRPGDLVGISSQRSLALPLAILAVLKAGAGYVPFDVTLPAERLKFMAQDTGISVLLGHCATLDDPGLTILAAEAFPGETDVRPDAQITGESIAYVMYTSGTTGTPKGVMVPHRSVMRLLCDADWLALDRDTVTLHSSAFAFDTSIIDFFAPLLNGGTVVIPQDGRLSISDLVDAIHSNGVNTLWLTSGLFHAIADLQPECFEKVKQLVVGGDVVSPNHVAKVQALCPDLRVINGYGPTESNVVSAHLITPDDLETGQAIPIGKAVKGTDLFVLDKDLNQCMSGQKGELYIGGAGLALGYWNRPNLTQEKFIPAPWDADQLLYRSGDLVEMDDAGVVRFFGRIDTQVKIRGFRVELDEVEIALEAHPSIARAAVVARAGADQADKSLIGFCVVQKNTGFDAKAVKSHLRDTLPEYACPARLEVVETLPLNHNGKVDRRALLASLDKPKSAAPSAKAPNVGADIATLISGFLKDILECETVDPNVNFFDLGASSLQLARLHNQLETALNRRFPITLLFDKSSVRSLAAGLSHHTESRDSGETTVTKPAGSGMIAIVGMAGRFPGARDIDAFWQKLLAGEELISHFSADELEVDPANDDPQGTYVAARGIMEDADLFDARHFNIPPQEAKALDPQHRIMLELAQTALDNAGHDPERFAGRIGIFAGSAQNSYLLNNVLSAPGAARNFAASYPVKDFSALFGNDKDFLATRVAYKLGLTGPAVNVQSACSTSLLAVAQACDSLRMGRADMVLAGGVAVTFPTKRPYAYLPDGMASADGHCRTFDADATGTVFGDGAGLVVLRRLEDAEADGDNIIAVIRGHGVNNDGAQKAGYAAPSIAAQAEAIRMAQAAAGVAPKDIGYVEAHGTATPLGDPIEFTALCQAFGNTGQTGRCAIGSVKTNVGHLDAAAGVTGLIKTALCLKHGKIPPLLHYTKPNPRIDFENSSFRPVAELTEWPAGEEPRYAGVSSFGVGGTNVHVVLGEGTAQVAKPKPKTRKPRLFPVSASSPEALGLAMQDLGAWALANPDADPDGVATTLREHRHAFQTRAVLAALDMAELAKATQDHKGQGQKAGTREKLVFMFAGQGSQHVGIARDLYDNEPVFRDALDQCLAPLEQAMGLDLRAVLYAEGDQIAEAREKLKSTDFAQPAIFACSYALAKLWESWGIRPDVMVGHSIGEFVAATLAGVFSLKDALNLIVLRGRLMADLPRGKMLSVRASEEDLQPYLGDTVDLAAVNGAKACVLAGSDEAIAALIPVLEEAGIATSELHTSHAFHSRMMDPALEPFRAELAKLSLAAPTRPILSTVTGDWMSEDEATDPDYWAQHMRRPVRFFDAMQVLWADGEYIFLESGPGRTLSVLAAQNPDRATASPALSSLPHAHEEQANAQLTMYRAFGELWACGYPLDWSGIGVDTETPRQHGMPSYPFVRKRFWIEPAAFTSDPETADVPDTAPTEVIAKPDALSAVQALLSDLSGLDAEEIIPTAGFMELGFDSLLLTQATRELRDQFGVAVSLRELIDGFPNVGALAEHIEKHGEIGTEGPSDQEFTPAPAAPEAAKADPQISAPVTQISTTDEALTPRQQAHIDKLVARFNAKTPQSKALTQKHRPRHADPRTASGFNRLWKDLVYQIVSVKSKGSRLLDVDGNEYVDILNGFGPGFLGHSPDSVVKALHTQLDDGFEVGPQSLLAMEAAELFCDVTGNDRASFVCTGSEAVYAAMRLARTVTGRDTIVLFARDYHGNFDEVLVRGVEGKDGLRSLPIAPGVPRDAVKNVVVLPYGSPQALDYIRRNAGKLAAVMVEPVQSRRPEFRPHEFIREVRHITQKHGALFIFDEVVTGFRFGPRGAQGYYNIEADLVTYGKIAGGGMPLGVVAGKAQYMDTFDGGQWDYGDDSFPEAPVTFFAGTFVRHPLVMAATVQMMRFFKSQPAFFWKTIDAKGDKVAGTVDRWFKENDMPFEMPNCGSLMYLRIDKNARFGGLLGPHLRDRGVFLLEGFPSYMTAAHDDEDIDHIINAIKDSAAEMRADGLIDGRADSRDYDPQITAAPPRLSLPGGEARIAQDMAAPLAPLACPTLEAQREIFAAQVVTPEVAAAYNESVTLKIRGAVNTDALLEAIQACYARHDALRATFSEDGLTMFIQPEMHHKIGQMDLSTLGQQDRRQKLQELLDKHVSEPFDMQNGPFLRTDLVDMGEEDGQALHHLVVTAHHIICDGWSIDVIMRDIARLYRMIIDGKPAILDAPHSIIDYARHEQDWAQSEGAQRDKAYWLQRFETQVPVLDLPLDHPRPAIRSVRGARLDAALDAELVAGLRKTAERQNSSFVTLLLAAFKTYVARISGNQDLVVGVPSAGQAANVMESMVGHCVNLMPIRTQPSGDKSFGDYLKEVKTALLDGADHQSFTYGALTRALKQKRDPSRPGLISVVFNVDNGIDLSALAVGSPADTFTSNPRAFENFELYLNVTEIDGGVTTEWSYNRDLFDAETIARHITGFSELLTSIVDRPDAPLGQLMQVQGDPTAPQQSPQTSPADYDGGITRAFKTPASTHQNRQAVGCNGKTLTYAELDRWSDRIAAHLLGKGVTNGEKIGLSYGSSLEQIAALLGILKAGGAYVPLDLSLPPERIEFIVKDTGLSLVLGPDAGLPRIQTLDVSVLPEVDPMPDLPELGGEDLAYVMYTSGSTGRPKGVMVPHRGVLRLVKGQDFADLGPDQRILQNSPIAFDAATFEIWGALLNGGALVLRDTQTPASLDGLGDIIARENITTLWLTAGLFHAMADETPVAFRPLQQLLTGGDVVSPVKAAQVLTACPDLTLINGYGPTENTTFTCCHRITLTQAQSGQALPIGHAINGTQIHVLDADLNPLPDGEMGELCVSGDGLALGYLGRADLTADKFVAAPWDENLRLYRTGDLVRRAADGVVQFYGRADLQVKIRGFRIELGEIETALVKHPGIRQAVVEARIPQGQSDKVLVAYYVPQDQALSRAELDDHMRDTLPAYARPTLFVALDSLPLSHNGKVDRKRLPAPVRGVQTEDPVAAESPEETRLLAIWAEVLGTTQLNVDDDFFELGGHSLLAVRLFARIHEEFGSKLPISTLFQHSTVRELARLLRVQDADGEFDPDADWDPSSVIHPGPEDGGTPLFVVGGAGGNVNNLLDFGAIMGSHRAVIGLQTRGILGHRMHTTIEAMAKDNIRYLRQHQPKGPYLLAGYSGGAITAFEMARQLEAAGEKVRRLFILDTYAPGFAENFRSPVHLGPREWVQNEIELMRARGLSYFKERLDARWRHGLGNKLLKRLRPDSPELALLQQVEQGWFQAAQSYDGGIFGGKTSLIFVEPACLKERKAFDIEPSLGWSRFLLDGQYRSSFLSGSHLGMVVGDEARVLVGTMEAHLQNPNET